MQSVSSVRQARQVLLGVWRAVRKPGRGFLCSAAGVLALWALLFAFDRPLLGLVRQEANWVRELGRSVSFWGDLPHGPALLIVSSFLIGWALKRSAWRHWAVICALGGLLGGLEAHLFRDLAGRTRPSANVEPGFYGPSLDHRYHSFVSAHTGAAFGAAAPLLYLHPAAGAVALTAAGAVGWSRLQENAHHPSDVWLAAWLGGLTGALLGRELRRLRREGPAPVAIAGA